MVTHPLRLLLILVACNPAPPEAPQAPTSSAEPSSAPSSAPATARALPELSFSGPPVHQQPSPAEMEALLGKLNDPRPAGAAEEGLAITIERSAPVYRMTLHGDGSVEFFGEADVRVQGEVRFKISPAKVRALADELRASSYFTLGPAPNCAGRASDRPTVTLRLARGGKKQEREHYLGETCLPNKLAEIEDRVDAVAQSKLLVQCPQSEDGNCRP